METLSMDIKQAITIFFEDNEKELYVTELQVTDHKPCLRPCA